MVTDAVVIGGGVIGVMTALRLSREGLTVTVVDAGEPGDGASARAGGVLAPLLDQPKPVPLVSWGVRSLARWPEVLDEWELRDAVGWALGALAVAESVQHRTDLERLRPLAEKVDDGVTWLEERDLDSVVPGLGRHVTAGLLYPGAARVDAPRALSALYRRAREVGVRFRWGVPALGVEVRGDHVRGVRLAGEVVPGGVVVVAGGAWTGQLLETMGELVPVFPVQGVLVAVADAVAPRLPVFGRGRYVIPRPDGLLLLGGTEAREGFRERPTVAAVRRVMDVADLYPPVRGGTVERVWAGLRPATPDGLPVIGAWPGVEGLAIAAGHYRNGWLLAPVTADLVRAWVLGEPWPEDAAPFRPDRFRLGDWPNWLES
jgi:glycine oxidase